MRPFLSHILLIGLVEPALYGIKKVINFLWKINLKYAFTRLLYYMSEIFSRIRNTFWMFLFTIKSKYNKKKTLSTIFNMQDYLKMLNKSILCENQTGLTKTQHLKKVYNLTVSSCTHHVFIEERYFIFVDDSFYITIQTCFYEMSLIIQSAIHCETSRHHRWVFKRLLSHRFRFFSTELLSRDSDLKRKIFCGTRPADLFHFILFRFCAKWRTGLKQRIIGRQWNHQIEREINV